MIKNKVNSPPPHALCPDPRSPTLHRLSLAGLSSKVYKLSPVSYGNVV